MESGTAIAAKSPSNTTATDDAEWQTRCDLAAIYRLVDQHGWTDLTYNHISARLPDAPGHYLVNPYGLLYEEVTASNLIKVDLETGTILDAGSAGAEANVAAHDLHGAVLRARPDLQCVAHVHTPAIMAVSGMAQGLIPVTQTAMGFYGRIGYHDYGFGGDACERMGRDFDGCDTVILRNHGAMIGGLTIAEAYVQMHNLQMACEAQVMAMTAGRDLAIPSQDMLDTHYKGIDHWLNRKGGPRDPQGCLEWQASLRMLRRRGIDVAQ